MTYSELYLVLLGAIALVCAGVVLFSIDKSSKYPFSFSRRKKNPHDT